MAGLSDLDLIFKEQNQSVTLSGHNLEHLEADLGLIPSFNLSASIRYCPFNFLTRIESSMYFIVRIFLLPSYRIHVMIKGTKTFGPERKLVITCQNSLSLGHKKQVRNRQLCQLPFCSHETLSYVL